MKRFFALLLLGAMLFALMPFALAEGAEEKTGETAPTEEIVQTASAVSVQNAAAKAANTATSIAFTDLRKTLVKYNYNVRALNETGSSLDDSMEKINSGKAMLNTYLNLYTDNATAMASAAKESADPMKDIYLNLSGLWTINKESMRSQIDSMEGQKVTIETTQNTCNDAVNQIVKGAESLYLGILKMESAVGDVQRGVDTLERMVKLTEKQKEIGMASDYDVEGMKYQYESAGSQLESLKYQIKTSKMTLEGMLGMELRGTVTLSTPDLPTDKELSEIDYDKKLSTAANRNVEVMNAEAKYYGDSPEGSYESVKAARDSFAYQFKIVCLNVPEQQRLLKVAADGVAYQKRTFEIAEKKYEMGMLSHEEYLSAEGELKSAESTLYSTKLDLITAYRAYVWATQYGIV